LPISITGEKIHLCARINQGAVNGFDKGETLPLVNEIIAEVIESFSFSLFIILFLLVMI